MLLILESWSITAATMEESGIMNVVVFGEAKAEVLLKREIMVRM